MVKNILGYSNCNSFRCVTNSHHTIFIPYATLYLCMIEIAYLFIAYEELKINKWAKVFFSFGI